MLPMLLIVTHCALLPQNMLTLNFIPPVLCQQMAPAKQMKTLQEFQRQSAQMDMTTEMMSDAIDDALDNDEAEEETDELTNQVLDEIGVDVASQLSTAPKGKIAGKKMEEVSS
ncbi:Vacuolar protein sorting-associated protein 2-like protein 3 [Bienertia sinuspersici]